MTSAAGGARADGRRPATACPRLLRAAACPCPPCTGLWQVSAADAGRPDSPSTLTAVSQAQRTLPSCPVPTDTRVPAAVGAASAGASNRRFTDTGDTSVFHPAAGRPHLQPSAADEAAESHHLRSSPEQADPALGRTIMRSVLTRCGLDPNCTVRDKGDVTGGWLRRRRCVTHPTPLDAAPPRTWPPRRPCMPGLRLPAPRPVGVDGLIV